MPSPEERLTPKGDGLAPEVDENVKKAMEQKLRDLTEEAKKARGEASPEAVEDANTLTALVQSFSNEFDFMCQQRHEQGSKKYGFGKFLEVDSLEMMCEELADAANYARYTFIKLRLILVGARKLMPHDVDGTTDKGPDFKKAGEDWGKE
jgi:hypothetical protein